jgi:hypothetical protein
MFAKSCDVTNKPAQNETAQNDFIKLKMSQ